MYFRAGYLVGGVLRRRGLLRLFQVSARHLLHPTDPGYRLVLWRRHSLRRRLQRFFLGKDHGEVSGDGGEGRWRGGELR